MEKSFIYKNDRPWPNQRFKRMAIVGHTTAVSSRFWFRTGRPGTYTMLLYPSQSDPKGKIFQGFKTVPYTAINSLPDVVRKFEFNVPDYDHDTTFVVEVDELSPLTEYCYALYGEEESVFRILVGQDRQYSFRTLPEHTAATSFIFYSCHMPYKHSIFGGTNIVNMEMWDFLSQVMERHYSEDLRFAIAGGDQVYVDGVKTLDIWKYLNNVMDKKRGELVPSKEEMVSWYRDIYRGYWGFPALQKVFSSYPNYMLWDDHELGDGWGSYFIKEGKGDELDEIFPKRKEKKLSREDCIQLLNRMKQAATQVYEEYQHNHNPGTPTGQYDYSVSLNGTAIYFLDGRGYRDVNRRSNRILGQTQLKRFNAWLKALDPAQTQFLFVVSAVPVLHMKPIFVNADSTTLADLGDLQDDLRDAWEHKLHDVERKALLKALFSAAQRGIRVCILSGDVHVSAAFRMIEETSGATMYQLTSSAITYNKPRLLGWLLGNTVPDDGKSNDGYRFERLALYTDSNFSLIRVDPDNDRVVFQLYGQQQVSHPEGAEEDKPMTHSIAKLELYF